MKFNQRQKPISERTETTNFEGGQAFEPEDPRLSLYKVVINNLLEDSFYESDEESFDKVQSRFEEVATTNPEFVLKLAKYARGYRGENGEWQGMSLRQIPQLLLVFAANHEDTKEYVREYAPSILNRADEPLEALAMQVKLFGKSIPNPLQKGFEDALHQFDEYELAKYDSDNREFQYRDFMALVHPNPRTDEAEELFERIVHGPLDKYPDVEPLTQHRTWENERSSDTTTETFTFEGHEPVNPGGSLFFITYEWDSGVEELTDYTAELRGADSESEVVDSSVEVEDGDVTITVEADLTEADEYRNRLDDMGLMAKVRNVRNMLEAGLQPDEILTDEDLESVPYNPMYPFRYYTAYKVLKQDRLSNRYLDEWFEAAIDKAVENVPEAFGDTYVGVDLSGSMFHPLSDMSMVERSDLSALFGAICAKKGAKTGGFGRSFTEFDFHSQTPVLQMQDTILKADVGHSTNGHLVLEHLTENDLEYDNVAIFTDEQMWNSGYGTTTVKSAWDEYTSQVNPEANLYIVDLAAHGTLTMPEGYNNVYPISGWTEDVIEHIDAASDEQAAIEEIEQLEA